MGTGYWLTGEPNNITVGGRYSENCVAMKYHPKYAGNWTDQQCSFKKGVICQRPAGML